MYLEIHPYLSTVAPLMYGGQWTPGYRLVCLHAAGRVDVDPDGYPSTTGHGVTLYADLDDQEIATLADWAEEILSGEVDVCEDCKHGPDGSPACAAFRVVESCLDDDLAEWAEWTAEALRGLDL